MLVCSATEEEMLVMTGDISKTVNTSSLYRQTINICQCSVCSAEAPAVQVPIEDLTVRPGQAAIFSTIITGQPIPEVQWFKVSKQNDDSAYLYCHDEDTILKLADLLYFRMARKF